MAKKLSKAERFLDSCIIFSVMIVVLFLVFVVSPKTMVFGVGLYERSLGEFGEITLVKVLLLPFLIAVFFLGPVLAALWATVLLRRSLGINEATEEEDQ